MDQSNLGASHNSTKRLWIGPLKVQSVMNMANAQFCKRRRKLDQSLQDFQSESAIRSSTLEKSSNRIVINLGIEKFSSFSPKKSSSNNPKRFENHTFKASSMADGNGGNQNSDDPNPNSDEFLSQFRRAPIPFGPKFQAEVPEWSETQKNEYDDDSDNQKWVGTKTWPIGDGGRKRKRAAEERIGKGRKDSCSCSSPGSINCVELHIEEERNLLTSALGRAFFDWKFDETGENVSENWSKKEERKFKSLMRGKMGVMNKKSFLTLALEKFPSKSKKSILSYYYNVFNMRRMREETRSDPFNEIESDEDIIDDYLN